MLKKKTIIFLIKACVSISILIIIFTNVDLKTAINNLKSANIALLFLALLSNLAERLELTYKWNVLIRVRGIKISFGRLFLINSIGGFLGLFLPSSLGTDVIRGYYLVKNNSEKSVSISSVFVDRVLGMFSLLLLCIISIFFVGGVISKFNIQLYIITLTVVVIFSFYFFQKKETARFLERILKRMRHRSIIENGLKLHSSILEYKKYPKTLLFTFSLTLLVQITRILTYYLVSLAFNISIPFIYFLLFIPIIIFVIMIPISIGGLGVREGTFVAFFTLIGISINSAVVISFTNSIIDTFNTIFIGGGAYLFYKSPIKKHIASEINTQ